MAYGQVETYGFELTFEPDGVYFQLRGTGEFTAGDILRWVESKQIQGVNLSLLEAAIRDQDFHQIKIAEAQEEHFLDESISVYLEQGNMQAYVILHQGDEQGNHYTMDSLKQELAKRHVTFGLDEEALKMVLGSKPYEEKILIAQGMAPENGKNGSIDYTFDISTEDRKGEQVGDRIDFKELHLYNNIKTGEVLAVKIPAQPGTPGRDVTGRSMDAMDGKEADFKYGKNIRQSEDGNQLLSEIDGRVELVSNKVLVSQVYNIQGNVDMAVGNVDFNGDVRITGNVLDGFSVKAKGSIEVQGVVENATLVAGNSIRIYQGVRGGGKAHLTAGGEVVSRFIEQGTIRAEEKIEAETIMHSNVFCSGPVNVLKGKGMIIGGNVCSANSIAARDIGADVGVATFVSIDLLNPMKERRVAVKERLEDLREDLKKLKLIRSKMMDTELIDEEKKAQIISDIATLGEEEANLEEEFSKLTRLTLQAKEGMISVKGRIYPGVRVTIGKAQYTVKEPSDYVNFKNVAGEIQETMG